MLGPRQTKEQAMRNQQRMYNPTLYFFDCHYGSRVLTVRAEGFYAAREKAAAYFKTAPDKITAVKGR